MQNPILSTSTRLEAIAIIELCLNIDSENKFVALFNKTRNLFDHEMAAIGIGDIQKRTVLHTLNLGFSLEFMKAIVPESKQMLSPLFQRWTVAHTPQLANLKDTPELLSSNGISPYLDFSVHNVMSHGLVDTDKKYATYFGFAGIPGSIGIHQIHLMKILAPHLHVAYTNLPTVRKEIRHHRYVENPNNNLNLPPENLLSNLESTEIISLTKREKEVLNRLFEGKSNWDISCKLHVSEFTVKNHVQNILKKLSASSRQHAVAIALKKKLIYLI